MSTPEPRVIWPNLLRPAIVQRDLVFVQGKNTENGTEPEKKFLVNVPLEVLVNGCLYLVIRDGHGLRSGQVLSRNIKLTEASGGSRSDPSSHHFVRYDGVNDARRSLGRLHGSYTKAEIPALRGWRNKLDWMMQTSWTLHRASEDETASFVWVAEELADVHGGVRDDDKLSAIVRTMKAGSKTDGTGRVNTGMIPLLCSAADRSLSRRTQAVRGIGRRMDWRAVVLEAYIDQLRGECRRIRNAARQRLSSENVFGEKRTQESVRTAARRMREFSGALGQVHARPFSRAFTHVSADLVFAASQMDYAAETIDAVRMEAVAAVLRKIYRSMLMLDYHARLEEVLVVIADYHHRGSEIGGAEYAVSVQEMAEVHSLLTGNDSYTGEPLEEGFRNSVLTRVASSVHLARHVLMHGDDEGSSKTSAAYRHLKEACAPF
jgi:hypothetical protein